LPPSGAQCGIDLARADRPDLRSTPDLKDIPVLLMTAKVHRSEVAFYVEKGAVGVI
jgi:hypothetical protein